MWRTSCSGESVGSAHTASNHTRGLRPCAWSKRRTQAVSARILLSGQSPGACVTKASAMARALSVPCSRGDALPAASPGVHAGTSVVPAIGPSSCGCQPEARAPTALERLWPVEWKKRCCAASASATRCSASSVSSRVANETSACATSSRVDEGPWGEPRPMKAASGAHEPCTATSRASHACIESRARTDTAMAVKPHAHKLSRARATSGPTSSGPSLILRANGTMVKAMLVTTRQTQPIARQKRAMTRSRAAVRQVRAMVAREMTRMRIAASAATSRAMSAPGPMRTCSVSRRGRSIDEGQDSPDPLTPPSPATFHSAPDPRPPAPSAAAARARRWLATTREKSAPGIRSPTCETAK
mmetsp:Transcript_8548/g.25164  ORF Transcript_8548/g.25164 Transcript_8548/m.25164 type:complete len:358 (+) Transcript_8548:1122-2195(+)